MTYPQTGLTTWRIHGGDRTLEIEASNWVEALGRALNGEVPTRMVLEARGAGGVAISLDGDRWSIFPAAGALTT